MRESARRRERRRERRGGKGGEEREEENMIKRALSDPEITFQNEIAFTLVASLSFLLFLPPPFSLSRSLFLDLSKTVHVRTRAIATA